VVSGLPADTKKSVVSGSPADTKKEKQLKITTI
jgi:hypothetical protein